MESWAHIVTVIIALLGIGLASYAIHVQKHRPKTYEERIHELESTVRTLQRVIAANETRMAELEAELQRERRARQILDGQLAFYAAAMSGMDPKRVEPPKE